MKGGLSSFFSLGVRVLLQLLQIPILYSAWGVNLASTWLVLWTLPSYLGITATCFSAAGGNVALTAAREGKFDEVRASYRATVIAISVSNLVLAVLIGGMFPLLFDSSKWNIDPSTLLWTVVMVSLYVLVRVQSSALELAYRYGGDYGAFGFYEAFATLGELLVMAIVVRLTTNLIWLPAGLTALRAMTWLVMWRSSKKRWPEVFGSVDTALVRKVLRLMMVPFLGFILSPILFAVNLQGYSILVSAVYGPALFATFLTTRTLVRVVDQLCSISNRLLFNELSYVDLQKSTDAVCGAVGLSITILLVAGIGYSGAMLMVGGPVHHLWTAGKVEFSPALVIIFAIAGVFRAIGDPVFSMLSSRNAHVSTTSTYLACSLAALGLAWILARLGAGMLPVASLSLIHI